MANIPESLMADESPREPLIARDETYGTITDQISSIVLQSKGPKKGWWVGFLLGFALLNLLLVSVGYLFLRGVGIWGLQVPVAWGFAIVNLVWWIGIGHAGTLISAVLLLLHQGWRTSINRFAEAMTLFAVACAGLFPLLHLGRPWYAYWIFPYPSVIGAWPQFRSPLVWDAFAISTYATVSFMFWYVGLIPDLATLRDRSKGKFARITYGAMSLGWRNSARHWRRYEQAYILLAGIATPLVVSVHSIVSFDFAVGIVPGWHTTVFPPYFVAGAIYSGFAMVLTISIPLRKVYSLQGLVTDRHLNNMAKVMLAAGLVVAYGYLMEIFIAFYSGHTYETAMIKDRFFGDYAGYYWALWICNILIPQALWIPAVRRNVLVLFAISIVINIGMWLERFVIIVQSLSHDFLPSSWQYYEATFWDWSTYLGTVGLFLTCLFLFVRILPVISIFEMRELLAHEQSHGPGDAHGDAHQATVEATETPDTQAKAVTTDDSSSGSDDATHSPEDDR